MTCQDKSRKAYFRQLMGKIFRISIIQGKVVW